MRARRRVASTGLAALVAFSAGWGTGVASSSAAPSGSVVPTVKVLAPGGVVIAEVARTEREQEIGLAGRHHMPRSRGMLFVISPARPVSMWMLDMRFSLDLVFVRDGIVTKVVRRAEPCPNLPCRAFPSGDPVDSVLELRGGQAHRLGLKPGAHLTLKP